MSNHIDLRRYLPLSAARKKIKIPVDHSTLTRWCRSGSIPAIRIGGRWHVDPNALRAAAVRETVQP